MYGLIKLHSRLEGDLRQRRKNLAHVRAVIKIVEPGFDVSTIKPRRKNTINPLFKRGEAFLLALDILREATEPMRGMDIAIAMLGKKGVTKFTPDERRAAWNAVKNTMQRYKGSLVSTVGRPHARRWAIKS
ncbi:MAG TPA: hypothetical protein VH206_17545 [Xanthobacteraceae bacterium]|jgi:hypothetical protein|nr:hypothetical protein [Xanthobacteraceae bacterium]